MKKHWISLLAALRLFVLIDRLGGWCCARLTAHSGFRYHRLYRGEAAADILLLGNSRGLSLYEPAIRRRTGKTTFNLSYNGLPAHAAQVLVADYYERYAAPEVLLIDITMCDRRDDQLVAALQMYGASSARLRALLRARVPDMYWAGRFSALFRYNSELFQRALYYRHWTDDGWLLDRQISTAQAVRAGQESYRFELHDDVLEALRATVALAQAHGSRVMLVAGPYFPGFRVPDLPALKARVTALTGLPVYDARDSIVDTACFGDYMHVNLRGAEVYTEILWREGLLGE
jgi:hypothetical protein